jgi:hypothetical protein
MLRFRRRVRREIADVEHRGERALSAYTLISARRDRRRSLVALRALRQLNRTIPLVGMTEDMVVDGLVA